MKTRAFIVALAFFILWSLILYSEGLAQQKSVSKIQKQLDEIRAHRCMPTFREGGIMVKVGQTVKRGEKIAEVGSTGRSTWNPFFTVYKNEQAVDPDGFLK